MKIITTTLLGLIAFVSTMSYAAPQIKAPIKAKLICGKLISIENKGDEVTVKYRLMYNISPYMDSCSKLGYKYAPESMMILKKKIDIFKFLAPSEQDAEKIKTEGSHFFIFSVWPAEDKKIQFMVVGEGRGFGYNVYDIKQVLYQESLEGVYYLL